MTSQGVTADYNNMAPSEQLILASSSVHRRALLERLRLPFRCHAPGIDETPEPGEAPSALVERLALAKARAVAWFYPQALIIGSDEVAALDGRIFPKPADHAEALHQLEAMSGREVEFLTGVCLLNNRTGRHQLDTVTVQVRFRQMTQAAIRRYLDNDKPYDCAGSFRSEAGGITLVHRISSTDNTALLGLPLIALQEMLRNEGYEIP